EPFDSGQEAYCASRGLIEFLVRRLTAAIPTIRIESGVAVRELIYREGRVRGVRCAHSRTIDAALVVDATGRGRRARKWLARLRAGAEVARGYRGLAARGDRDRLGYGLQHCTFSPACRIFRRATHLHNRAGAAFHASRLCDHDRK